MKWLRGIYIFWIFFRYGLDELILSSASHSGLRAAGRLITLGRDLSAPRGVRLRVALEKLGPLFVKFGQVLSTRRDLLPPDMAIELAKLQDRVPPFSADVAIATIERAFGKPLESLFVHFEREPVASASVAQVHYADLVDRQGVRHEVAVKVLRPDLQPVMEKDVSLMRWMAGWIERVGGVDARRLKPCAVVEEFNKYLHDELDLMREAANAAQLRRNMANSQLALIPEMHWDLCATEVIVMERMRGVPISQLEKLRSQGVDLRALAANGMKLFFTQVFHDGFFHADMHHGNLKVGPDGAIIAYDFGIMGRLDDYTRRVYAEILFGFIRKDYRRVAEVHFEAGYVPADRDIDEFARALRVVGEPIFGMDASRISMARLLAYLFEVTERFGMETRTELILLQRTMVVVEGVARSLDPHINIWQVARPVVEDYIKTNVGPRALLRDLVQTARVLGRFGPKLPALVEAQLIRQSEPPQPAQRQAHPAVWMLVGGALVALGVGLGALL